MHEHIGQDPALLFELEFNRDKPKDWAKQPYFIEAYIYINYDKIMKLIGITSQARIADIMNITQSQFSTIVRTITAIKQHIDSNQLSIA